MPEPVSMVVPMRDGERIHYLDWSAQGGSRVGGGPLPGVLLLHGICQTAWSWAPVARRLAAEAHVLAMDLRGHGLSEAPRTGYTLEDLAWDALGVLSGAGFGTDVGGPRAVVAGHGVGAMVAVTMAGLRPDSIGGLALLDGGWEDVADATRATPAEFVAQLAEPPEVLASLDAFLADRRDFDPATWDADQERAARAQVEQKYAGHIALVTRPQVVRAVANAMFEYRPVDALAAAPMPVAVLVAEPGGPDDEVARERRLALDDVVRARDAAGVPTRVEVVTGAGHNLMRYRPDVVTVVVRDLVSSSDAPRDAPAAPPRTSP